MSNHRLIRNGRVFLLIFLIFTAQIVVHAQDTTPPNTLSLSEAQINTALQANNQNPDNDLSVDLQPGQFVVNLVTTGQRGNTTRLGLTIVPSIVAGRLQLDATQLTINDLALSLNDNPAARAIASGLNDFLSEQTEGGQLQRIAITDNTLRIDWLNADPNAPIITIQDNRFSLTFTEAAVNAMQWVTNPTGAQVSGIQVDLQPGQAVVDVSRTVSPTTVRYTLVPTVVNGIVTWDLNVGADYENGSAAAIASLWQAYFDGIYRQGTLSDAVITDDRVTFTWDMDQVPTGPGNDPVVTYATSEAEVNAALASYTTAEVSQLAVDMQPGKVVIHAAGTNDAGAAYTASLSLLPILTNGVLTWQPERITINDLVIDADAFNSSHSVTEQLTQGIGSNRNRGTITNLRIDDTSMTITVRYN